MNFTNDLPNSEKTPSHNSSQLISNKNVSGNEESTATKVPSEVYDNMIGIKRNREAGKQKDDNWLEKKNSSNLLADSTPILPKTNTFEKRDTNVKYFQPQPQTPRNIVPIIIEEKKQISIKENKAKSEQMPLQKAEIKIDRSMIPESTYPKLQNIVSTVNLGCALNLRDIALKARNSEYNPKRFAAVIMRIREPKTTALIFASGKMVCTGARSEDDSKKAARKFAKIIRKLDNPVKFTDFKIQNIVGSCDVEFPIRLEGLAADCSKLCSFEPEMFPGLIFRMIDPKIVLLIFVSGKIVLTGAKEKKHIFDAYTNIYSVLKKYDKNKDKKQLKTEAI